MEEIYIIHHHALDVPTLTTLFGTNIMPARLTRLEIVKYSRLHPIKHLKAIATLLQRVLPLLEHLKLHLCDVSTYPLEDFLALQYNARLEEHPEEQAPLDRPPRLRPKNPTLRHRAPLCLHEDVLAAGEAR